MIYRDFMGEKLSLLGFGTMRLPTVDGEVDEAEVRRMVEYASAHGVNYYDTAYPYHNSKSELVVGKILSELPRNSFYLATKYPGHQIAESYDPRAVFEEQLEKCRVEYFDFYLLHNVYENSIRTYKDPRWGIMDYFIEQKRRGRIRHLGFSTHGLYDTVTEFLDLYGDEMEFCQIQLNYLDWTLQHAKEKYELLTSRGIPVFVMEPVRGGKLANLGEEAHAALAAHRSGVSDASFAFRFLMRLKNVNVILSGMSDMAQMKDNIKTFEEGLPASDAEAETLLKIAETMKNSVPCTACRYCCAGCPRKLDIPKLLSLYNEMRVAPSSNVGMIIDSLDENSRPDACIGCGRCSAICPQKIDIPDAMKDFSARLEKVPHWADICREREKAARRLREGK